VLEPYDAGTAKSLIRRILTGGRVAFGTHADKEMAKDQLGKLDLTNVLRAGAVSVNCFDGTHWRYTVETAMICVVILFRGEKEIRVVTAWRK